MYCVFNLSSPFDTLKSSIIAMAIIELLYCKLIVFYYQSMYFILTCTSEIIISITLQLHVFNFMHCFSLHNLLKPNQCLLLGVLCTNARAFSSLAQGQALQACASVIYMASYLEEQRAGDCRSLCIRDDNQMCLSSSSYHLLFTTCFYI